MFVFHPVSLLFCFVLNKKVEASPFLFWYISFKIGHYCLAGVYNTAKYHVMPLFILLIFSHHLWMNKIICSSIFISDIQIVFSSEDENHNHIQPQHQQDDVWLLSHQRWGEMGKLRCSWQVDFNWRHLAIGNNTRYQISPAAISDGEGNSKCVLNIFSFLRIFCTIKQYGKNNEK